MLGADKGLLLLHGQPLVVHALQSLAPQVGRVIISANRNLAAYRELAAPYLQSHSALVVPDDGNTQALEDFNAPLLGPLAALAAALPQVSSEFLLFWPADSAKAAPDFVANLHAALGPHDAVYATSEGRAQPLHALVRTAAAQTPNLHDRLANRQLQVHAWLHSLSCTKLELPAPPRNFNTPADWL